MSEICQKCRDKKKFKQFSKKFIIIDREKLVTYTGEGIMKKLLAGVASIVVVSVAGISAEGTVKASDLLNVINNHSTALTGTTYMIDEGVTPTVSINQVDNSTNICWMADMDVDCDGLYDARCAGDPTNQSQLSCGTDINPADVPFYVIPIYNNDWDYRNSDIDFGQLGAIIYNNKVEYAVFLDECGLNHIIGEASYAAVNDLGVDPNPDTGGTDDPVGYVIFTGPNGRLSESNWANHSAAVTAGNQLAQQLTAPYVAIRAGETPLSSSPVVSVSRSAVSVKMSGSYVLSVSNTLGAKIASMSGKDAQTFNMSNLPRGAYLYSVKTMSGKTALNGKMILN